MAGAAGYLGAHVLHPDRELGAAYDAAMQELVFDALGMSKTTFDYAKAQAGNHAAPHALDIDGKQRVATMGINDAGIPSRPDGAAWSTVRDTLSRRGPGSSRPRGPGEHVVAGSAGPLELHHGAVAEPQEGGGSDPGEGDHRPTPTVSSRAPSARHGTLTRSRNPRRILTHQ